MHLYTINKKQGIFNKKGQGIFNKKQGIFGKQAGSFQSMIELFESSHVSSVSGSLVVPKVTDYVLTTNYTAGIGETSLSLVFCFLLSVQKHVLWIPCSFHTKMFDWEGLNKLHSRILGCLSCVKRKQFFLQSFIELPLSTMQSPTIFL